MFNFVRLAPDMRNNPMNASITPKMDDNCGLILKTNNEKIGTRTTFTPVINPAFDAEVY